MTYGHLQADCLYTGISYGPNARYRVWKAFTFYLYASFYDQNNTNTLCLNRKWKTSRSRTGRRLAVTSCDVVGRASRRMRQVAAAEPEKEIRRRLSWRPCHVTLPPAVTACSLAISRRRLFDWCRTATSLQTTSFLQQFIVRIFH